MIEVFEKYDGNHRDDADRGRGYLSFRRVIDAEEVEPNVYRIRDMVNRRLPRLPSDLAIIGRYIFTPDIFEAIERAPGAGGEIQMAAERYAAAVKGQAVLRR